MEVLAEGKSIVDFGADFISAEDIEELELELLEELAETVIGSLATEPVGDEVELESTCSEDREEDKSDSDFNPSREKVDFREAFPGAIVGEGIGEWPFSIGRRVPSRRGSL